jgi:nitrogen fixation protein NifU and related proteins
VEIVVVFEGTDFPAIYLDHFQNPRNVGITDTYTHKAEQAVEPGFGCFDTLEMTLRIDHDIIEQARFRGRLCSGSIAAASLLMSIIEGKPVAEVRKLDEEYLQAIWHTIPRGKEHSIQLSISTLRNALNSPLVL